MRKKLVISDNIKQILFSRHPQFWKPKEIKI